MSDEQDDPPEDRPDDLEDGGEGVREPIRPRPRVGDDGAALPIPRELVPA